MQAVAQAERKPLYKSLYVQVVAGIIAGVGVGSCLSAERCWDQVRWSIEAYAWRFEGSRRASSQEHADPRDPR